ncbi:protein transport protein Sec61 subunit gamma [Drosophila novamexicana]|uniref:protein transport protein Sec61 subunit gamma n=1 Tax=Drosophila novamexicana TaxID=47314 RepID=UPI0011E589B1|nr:protein transport protein Sec61 subunit gamma [Drosophila novamexicana]
MDQRLQRRRRMKKKPKSGLSRLLLELAPKFKSSTSYTQLVWDQVLCVLLPLLAFFRDSVRVIKRCTKPDRQEFLRSALAITVGFLIMGFLGFIIKLLHIPITNIIMG